MKLEEWKDIEGFEGEYAISTRGRVKNLKTNRILVGVDNGAGYKIVKLKGKNHRIHRLVALAFIPNPKNLQYINHIDEKKDNNDVSNLEWCSASYNTNYSIYKQCCKIKQIDKDGNIIKVWESSQQIGRETDYKQSAIIECCKGKRRSAYNFRWEYLDSSSQRVINRPVIVHKGSEYIGTFANAVKASKALGLCDRSVYFCLQGRYATLYDYRFKYVE